MARRASLAFALIGGLTLFTLPAQAAFDLTGEWQVSIQPEVGLIVPCTWTFTQAPDGALSVLSNCAAFPPAGVMTGALNLATGTFSLFASTPDNIFCPATSYSGATDALSTLISGTFACFGGLPPFNVGTFAGGGRCGNTSLDVTEECDPPGQCCTASCRLVAAGTTCQGDTNTCTLEACDGANSCLPNGPAPDGRACIDGNECTTDDVCTAGSCGGSPSPAGQECEGDDDSCTIDACDGAGSCTTTTCSPCCDAMAGCTPALDPSCKGPVEAAAALAVTAPRYNPVKHKLSFSLPNGEASTAAELGDPTTTDDYTFCLYRATHSLETPYPGVKLLTANRLPAGGTCGSKPCWKPLATGYRYKDSQRTPDGIDRLVIQHGSRTRIALLGKGGNLFAPDFDSHIPVTDLTAQLRTGAQCFEATFHSAVYTGPQSYKASGGE